MIGELLKKERERQGFSIKDVETATRIRAFYIEAIEKGDREALPSDVYVKGFIRNYAQFLQLDESECVQRYQSEYGLQEPAEPAVQNPSSTAGSEGISYQEEKEGSGSRLALFAVLLVGVGLAGGWLFFGDSGADKGNSPKPAVQQSSSPASKPAAAPVKEKKSESVPAAASGQTKAPQGESKPAAAPAAGQGMGGVQIQAQFTDRCWMQVIADGQVVYEGTAVSGENKVWKAKDKIFITAGNAGAVTITRNGQMLGHPGNYGEVAEMEYTKEKP